MSTINKDNYFAFIKKVDQQELPFELRQACLAISLKTQGGKNWNTYSQNPEFKKLCVLTFEKLEAFLNSKNALSGTNATSKKETSEAQQEIPVSSVDRLPDELRFIRRFVSLHEKKKSKNDILRFINTLQKSIAERRIRKTSAFADEIKYIQNQLIKLYYSMQQSIVVKHSKSIIVKFKEILASEKVKPSVRIAKRVINLHAKAGMREKAKDLLATIERTMASKKISRSERHSPLMQNMLRLLKQFITNKSEKTLRIEQSELSGLQGIIDSSENIDGFMDEEPPIINSVDFAKMEFPSIGFKNKYLDFIGDPAPGFTLMVYGLPKMGKSSWCIDFAKYLAQNHGKVLYVAKEEGAHKTLQNKVKGLNAINPNLEMVAGMRSDLSAYDFIFLDSVNKLGLSADDLNNLKTKYPNASFIYIFQSTKSGNFRGANEFQHDVDSIVEIPNVGKAIQYGRFNQGGEMDFYDKNIAKTA